jgi:hypothetical protein
MALRAMNIYNFCVPNEHQKMLNIPNLINLNLNEYFIRQTFDPSFAPTSLIGQTKPHVKKWGSPRLHKSLSTLNPSHRNFNTLIPPSNEEPNMADTKKRKERTGANGAERGGKRSKVRFQLDFLRLCLGIESLPQT